MDEESKQQPEGSEQAEAAAGREEELRRRMEEQLRKVRVQDLLLESVVGIANLTARRLAKEDERDLEQARVGIEAMRAVVGLLEPEPAKQVQQALSELQMLYAQHAGGAAGEEQEGGAPSAEAKPPPRARDSRLWTPPGT